MRRARCHTSSPFLAFLSPGRREAARHALSSVACGRAGARRREPARCNGWAEQLAASATGRADPHASIARPGGTGTDGVLVEARASCLPCFHVRSSYCELRRTVDPQIPVVDFTKFLRRLAHFGGSSGDQFAQAPSSGRQTSLGHLRVLLWQAHQSTEVERFVRD